MTFFRSLVLSASLIACSSPSTSATPSSAGGGSTSGAGKTGTWSQLNSGMTNTSDVTSLASQGTTLYALTNEGTNNFYVSVDAATTWTHATGDLKIPGVADDVGISAFALNGTSVVAGAGLLFSSANNGVNWTVIDDTQSNAITYTMVRVFGSDIFVGTLGGVLVSHDGGGQWGPTQMDDGSGGDTAWADGVPATMASLGGKYFAGVSLGKSVWVSSTGDHWATANAGLPPGAGDAGGTSITAFAVHGTVLLAGTAGGVFKSGDSGVSWSAANSGLINASDLTGPTTAYAFAVSGSTIYVGTDSGVYTSSNDGASWAKLDRGDLPDFASVYAMTVMGNNLYIGTYTTGVWRHAL